MPRERILVVDDEPEVLELCTRVLAAEGYEVQGVNGGQKAIALVQQERFDLLLTDIRMPDIDGLEMVRTIKELDSELIFVTMTGFGTMDTAIEALKLGVDEFVVKPFTPNDLCLALAKALEKERLRRENVRLRALIPLFELNKTLMATVDVNEVLSQVVRISRQETGADRVSLLLLSADWPSSTQMRAYTPLESRSSAQERFDQAVAERAMALEGPLVLQGNVEEDSSLPKIAQEMGIYSLIASPIAVKDKVIGILILTKESRGGHFVPGDAELLSVLSGQAAVAIENARLFEEIQRAYQELRKLDHLKSEFINIAAHELRTPLAILMGYASIMEEDAHGDSKERLQIIVRNAMRLRSLIDNMLDLRHLETGQNQLRLSRFSLNGAVISIVGDLTPMARDKGQRIRVHGAEKLVEINTDHHKFDLILVNLLSNAIKFTPEGGEISVEVRPTEDAAIVSVRDTGIGIPPEEQERIFDRFYQVSDSLTREHGGMGLGLTIAKGMVELCGGRIWVESEVGQGSTFTFIIPRRPE